MPILEHYRRLPFPQFIPAPAVDYIDLLAKRESAAVLALQPIGLYSIKMPKDQCKMEKLILANGAPTPNGHRVTTSIVLRLVNVCIAFIALMVSGSADVMFPLIACMGWFISSIVLMVSTRKEDCHG